MDHVSRALLLPATAALLGLCVFAGPQIASARPAAIAHPNPAFVSPLLDYVGPIRGAGGQPATLTPLDPAVIVEAVADRQYLAFKTVGDLGGFAPAPTGQFALSSGGRNLVGGTAGGSEIPQFAQAADGKVNSFAAVGPGTFTPPDQGNQPVPGLGTPPPVIPPSNNNRVPPPNQGFGGTPSVPPTTTTTEPVPTTPPPTRTTPTTPTVPVLPPPTTTTVTTTPTPTPTPAPTAPSPPTTSVTPPFVGASCGTTGLTITSDHTTCRIYAVNMAPGGSASEVMTLRNDTDAPFTLSLQAAGTVNALWNALQLGVWVANTAAPGTLPALLWWTTQSNQLATLEPGESIRYQIELYLPPTAGNHLEGLAASIDLIWRAQG
jgi:hypothetical protein